MTKTVGVLALTSFLPKMDLSHEDRTSVRMEIARAQGNMRTDIAIEDLPVAAQDELKRFNHTSRVTQSA